MSRLYRRLLFWVAWLFIRPDGEMDKFCDKLNELTWQIIRRHPMNDPQLNYKLSLLRDLMHVDWTDGRQLALLESIRNECLDVKEAS